MEQIQQNTTLDNLGTLRTQLANTIQPANRLTFLTVQFLVMLAIRKIPNIGYFLRSGCAKIGNVDFRISDVDNRNPSSGCQNHQDR